MSSVFALEDALIESMFSEQFNETVAQYNNIDDVTVNVSRNLNDRSVRVEVPVYGFADTPTLDEFLNGDVVEAAEISIVNHDGESYTFELSNEESYITNGNEFTLVYVSVQ